MADESHVLIAHLEERRYDRTLPFVSLIAIAIGTVLMILSTVFETSSNRVAAAGTIWTGWNVLCGIGILSRRPVHYLIYRQRLDEG
jgi:hypothetical protein